ncbi:MAG: SulP family inorganic anion transporter [Porphyromonas sp.]|nr:SulP family inorganic anion transporter [Porphyromonas sp.]
MIDFRPRILDSFRGYDGRLFAGDAMAGTIVALVAALPLALAFAIASGVSPEVGLLSAIVGGGLIALLSGSKVQIGGPTGSFIVIAYAVLQTHGLQGLMLATLMAGVMLIAMGVLKLGTLIKYMPYPVVIGFTAGMAVIIASTQVNELLGLGLTNIPADFLDKWSLYLSNLERIDWPTLAVGLATIAIIELSPRITKAIPGALVALVLMTLSVYALRTYTDLDSIATIGDRFSISGTLPPLQLPRLDFLLMAKLVEPAFSIALLAVIESLLTARIVDGMIGDKHSPNTELIALGIANIAVPFIGGLPVTGATARTMTNVNNGGRTPMAGIIHALVLLLSFLWLMPLVSYIPMAALGGVLMVVAINMSGWRTIRNMLRGPKMGSIVLLTTLFFTVFGSLLFALETGILLSMIFIIKRMIDATSISVARDTLGVNSKNDDVIHTDTEHLDLPQGVEVYELEGPFFFGTASGFEEQMEMALRSEGRVQSKVCILRMRFVPFMDSTAIHNLEDLYINLSKQGARLILSGVNERVLGTLQGSGLSALIGEEYICRDIHRALEVASKYLQEQTEAAQ